MKIYGITQRLLVQAETHSYNDTLSFGDLVFRTNFPDQSLSLVQKTMDKLGWEYCISDEAYDRLGRKVEGSKALFFHKDEDFTVYHRTATKIESDSFLPEGFLRDIQGSYIHTLSGDTILRWCYYQKEHKTEHKVKAEKILFFCFEKTKQKPDLNKYYYLWSDCEEFIMHEPTELF